MDATDRLRALLDERGVEWMPSVWSANDETFYKVGEIGYLATELSSERMKVCIEGYPTPEQAIEATLGRGECRDVNEEDNDFICSECGASLFTMIDGCWTMVGRSGLFKDVIKHPKFCPNCGAKVVKE